MKLRPYQHEALDSIEKAFFDQGQWRQLMQMPTGGGKTVVFSQLPLQSRILAWLESFPSHERKMLVIAHREELLDQAAEKLRAANPDAMVSIEQGDRHANRYSQIVVASIQTLAAVGCRRLDRLMASGTFRLVVVDESHHASANSYRDVLASLGFLPPRKASANEDEFADATALEQAVHQWDATTPKDQRLLVGVTATPNRSDAVGLNCVFQTISYQYGIKAAIGDGWLVPVRSIAIETTTGLDDVKVNAGEFNQRQLADAVNTPARNATAVAAWLQYAKELPTLAFTVDVRHAHDLAGAFKQAGVRAAAVSGETPREERRQILEDYLAQRYDVVTNAMLLTEGTDLPLTACILNAKPTKSATLYTQLVGRGLRLAPGKDSCLILDLVDQSRKHSLQATPVLFGLPPGLKMDGQDLRDVDTEWTKLQEEFPAVDFAALLNGQPLSLAALRAKAVSVDVWAIPSLGTLASVVTQSWIKLGADTYRLQYPWADGKETIEVRRDMLGHFDVACTLRPSQGGQTRQQTLGSQIPTAVEALMLAETFVSTQRSSAAKLTDRGARWRNDLATSGQMGLLRRLRVPFDPKTLTKGKASDLINLANARGR